MPFLALVHLRDVRCGQCGCQLAGAGARSFIVDRQGNPLHFSSEDPPAQLMVELRCPNAHVTRLNVPNDVAAEEALATPDAAPIALDAQIVSGTTDGGASLP